MVLCITSTDNLYFQSFIYADPLSINTVGPTSADIVGAIIGVSVSLSTIVVIIAIILCAIFLGYMYIHKESRIGHFVKKVYYMIYFSSFTFCKLAQVSHHPFFVMIFGDQSRLFIISTKYIL